MCPLEHKEQSIAKSAKDDPQYKLALTFLEAFMECVDQAQGLRSVFAVVATKEGAHSIMNGALLSCANEGCKGCQALITKARALVMEVQPWEKKH